MGKRLFTKSLRAGRFAKPSPDLYFMKGKVGPKCGWKSHTVLSRGGTLNGSPPSSKSSLIIVPIGKGSDPCQGQNNLRGPFVPKEAMLRAQNRISSHCPSRVQAKTMRASGQGILLWNDDHNRVAAQSSTRPRILPGPKRSCW